MSIVSKKPTADCKALIDESVDRPLLSDFNPLADFEKTKCSISDASCPSQSSGQSPIEPPSAESPTPESNPSFTPSSFTPRHLRSITGNSGPASLDIRVRRALALLAGMKEKVIQMRYGLFNGRPPMSYQQIADELSASLTPAQRWVLARKSCLHPDKVKITDEEVVELEAQALREMRPRSQQFKMTASQN